MRDELPRVKEADLELTQNEILVSAFSTTYFIPVRTAVRVADLISQPRIVFLDMNIMGRLSIWEITYQRYKTSGMGSTCVRELSGVYRNTERPGLGGKVTIVAVRVSRKCGTKLWPPQCIIVS